MIIIVLIPILKMKQIAVFAPKVANLVFLLQSHHAIAVFFLEIFWTIRATLVVAQKDITLIMEIVLLVRKVAKLVVLIRNAQFALKDMDFWTILVFISALNLILWVQAIAFLAFKAVKLVIHHLIIHAQVVYKTGDC